jgi:hypothetical protein
MDGAAQVVKVPLGIRDFPEMGVIDGKGDRVGWRRDQRRQDARSGHTNVPKIAQ